MKFYGISIDVSDVNISREFYKEMLGLQEAWHIEEMNAAGLRLGNVEFILVQSSDKSRLGVDLRASICVDDIHQIYQDLCAKGARFTKAPWKEPWGGTVAFLLDPDGNKLMLFT